MTIEEISEIIGARLVGARSDCQVSRVLTDSRSLLIAKGTMFFALVGARGDGHRYIVELYQRGVRCFCVQVVSEFTIARCPEATFLVVDDTLKALQCFAASYRRRFDIPVVGITGSNGKTIVKEWLSKVLADAGMIVARSPRSYNSQIGVPLSLFTLEKESQIGVFEAGISQKSEMEKLAYMIAPTLGILTNIGEAHSSNFCNNREKTLEKLRLMTGTNALVYCKDDENVAECVTTLSEEVQRVAWSRADKSATLFVESEETTHDSTFVTYIYKGKTLNYRLPFVDEASVENSINVVLAALTLGVDTENVKNSIEQMESLGMRLELKEGRSGCTVINDAYSLDLNSLQIALDFMKRRSATADKWRTVILSDVLQSDLQPSELYTEIERLLKAAGVDRLIGVGEMMVANQDKFEIHERQFFSTTDELIQSGVLSELSSSLVLVKGAREFHFERIAALLEGRVHETVLEVNLESIVENLNYYRSLMYGSGAKICCMVKADAYGAGAIEVSRTLQEHRADYLAVAVADEGAALRQAGIRMPIMVMNPERAALHTLFEFNLEPEVYSFRLLRLLIDAARREGITDYPVHLKLDTGMHRLGFHPENDVEQLVDLLKSQNNLAPRSVFSHFVGSDDDVFDDFSQHQWELFQKGASVIENAFPTIMKHIDNTAGIEHFPMRQMQMCRLGLGLYGVNPRGNATLNVVSRLATTILQVRDVPAGESVGYSRRTVLERPSRIAAIPIGYADGLNRHLGNRRGYCLVHGKPAPYIGNICMDVCMIDITDIPDVQEGDCVEIFGPNLPVQQLAEWLDTIPYEVLTGITSRTQRVYFQG